MEASQSQDRLAFGDFPSQCEQNEGQIADLLRMSLQAFECSSFTLLSTEESEDHSSLCLRFKAPSGLTLEQVRSEVQARWRTHVCHGNSSLYMFRSTDDGFDFRFSVFHDGSHLTGVYSVQV